MSYFRNLVEAHASNAGEEHLRDLIGWEAGYTPRYENSLKVIPFDQLNLVHGWDTPLGSGDNGAVYAAVWRRPPGFFPSTRSGEVDVVLKEVRRGRGKGSHDLSIFMKEVSSVFQVKLRLLKQ